MGQGGRVVCVGIPMLLTAGALIALVMVFIGGLSKSSDLESSLYFLQINTTKFVLASKLGIDKDDWYQIGLWNYCSGNNNDTNTPLYCSPRQAYYYFNPIEVWNLTNSGAAGLMPAEWKHMLDTYKAVAKWMFIGYVVSLVTTAATLVLGIFGFFSRLGSLLTWFVAGFATLFTLLASITATALYVAVEGGLHDKVGGFGIHSKLGHNIFVVTWLACAFNLAAGTFWLFSVCCCGAGQHHHRGAAKEAKLQKQNSFGMQLRGRMPTWGQNKNYERVPSPYMGVGGHQHTAEPLHDATWAPPQARYEDFRAAP